MVDDSNYLRNSGQGPTTGILETQESLRKHDLSEAQIQRVRLPAVLFGTSTEFIQDKLAKKVTKKYLAEITDRLGMGDGLIISGKIGVGKTIIAAMIAAEAAKWGYSALFMNYVSLQDSQFDNIANKDGEFIKERLQEVDLLVLDGLNEDFIINSRFGPLQAEHLISIRNDFDRSTILTTRLSPSNIESKCRDLLSIMKAKMAGFVINGIDMRTVSNPDLKKRLGLE